MENEQVDWLVYVDSPAWNADATDWRRHISAELRAAWPTFSYEQKWAIAQEAARMPQPASPSHATRKRAELDAQGGVAPVDRPDAPMPSA